MSIPESKYSVESALQTCTENPHKKSTKKQISEV